MLLDSDLADFREHQLVADDLEAGLRVGETVIARARAEARKTGTLAPLDAPKESLKRLIQAAQSILQNLTVHFAQLRPRGFDFRQLVLLVKIPDVLSFKTPRFAALLKSGVIKLTAQVKRRRKARHLRFRRIDSITTCFEHLLHALRFDILLDDFQRCSADRHKEIRRTPQVAFPQATFERGKFLEQTSRRHAFETIDGFRELVRRLRPKNVRVNGQRRSQ